MKLNACLTSDAWSNIKNEPIVNYMLISDSSTFFLESVSTGEQSHDAKWIAQDMGRMIDSLAGKAPLFTPISPMLTDCGIISLDAHAILARVRLTVKATTLKTPLRTLLLPSTIPSHSNSWFWTRRSRSLIRFVHPNMSLFHFNIPISTNGLFHNPISTNSSITSSNISRSIPNTQSLHTRITTTSTTIPSTPTISEIRHQRSKYAFERTFQVWGKSKLACSYVQANHASSAKFLRSPALSTGQAIGSLSPLTGPLWWPMGLS
ncbi:hypothetical protein BASA62_005884 [Batrachochytrium salamandrivorans]|nr:hypothetical protein BASA62_005884 [Batrachochytrium salamandrivorans]